MDEHNVVVNISDELEKSIAEMRPHSFTCSIYRVPPRLRNGNEKAYTPMVISIGPLHHGNKSLQMMEDTKMQFVKNFIGRPNVSLRECVKIVKEREEELRGCYHETCGLKDDEFVKVILVDAIFIVELFLIIYHQRLYLPVERERLLDAVRVFQAIGNDLLLLENQLPFFILEEIWKCATVIPINRIFYDHFNSEVGLHSKSENDLETLINNFEPYHFVDLLRRLYIPLEQRRKGKATTFHAPSAIELRRAGVEFKVIESSKSLLDVSFSNGILEIPKWRITDPTEVIFRNLIAFEQCHLWVESYTCHYHSLMDFLINSTEDVDLLIKNKIIENWLGDSNEVASVINKLGNGVVISENEFYFADIFKDLNDHCGKPGNECMADLKQNYLSTPWTFISFCAALLLLILTIIQTVCSIISLTK